MIINAPILITNFKAYKESTGANAVDLAKLHERIANEFQINFAVAGQAMDLMMLASSVSIPVFAQHVDGVGYGAYTGSIPVEIAHNMGVDGSILNHSECGISDRQIELAIEDLKKLGMTSLVCAENDEEGHKFAMMGANYIAIEPPELIGGDISVSSAKPDLIKRSVERIGQGRVIVGAGIKTAEDLRIALSFGAVGCLVASGVVKAQSQSDALKQFAQGMQSYKNETV